MKTNLIGSVVTAIVLVAPLALADAPSTLPVQRFPSYAPQRTAQPQVTAGPRVMRWVSSRFVSQREHITDGQGNVIGEQHTWGIAPKVDASGNKVGRSFLWQATKVDNGDGTSTEMNGFQHEAVGVRRILAAPWNIGRRMNRSTTHEEATLRDNETGQVLEHSIEKLSVTNKENFRGVRTQQSGRLGVLQPDGTTAQYKIRISPTGQVVWARHGGAATREAYEAPGGNQLPAAEPEVPVAPPPAATPAKPATPAPAAAPAKPATPAAAPATPAPAAKNDLANKPGFLLTAEDRVALGARGGPIPAQNRPEAK